jgi:hypothetical protein
MSWKEQDVLELNLMLFIQLNLSSHFDLNPGDFSRLKPHIPKTVDL